MSGAPADGSDPHARRLVALAVTGAATPARQRRAALERLARHGTAPPHAVLADLERHARSAPQGDPDAACARLAALGARVLALGAAGYPERLAQLWPELGAPLWLFAIGLPDALDDHRPAVAVVGSRNPSLDGADMAEELGRILGRAGVSVVSGMARGIDEAAHRGALAVGGRTVAVLGTGFGVDYPRGRATLRAAIVASGALVTELPPDCPPRGHQFLERNRLIAGLSDAVVVVEGRARSGALATARLAAEQGRDVWAVPGSPHQPTARAPLDLIRDGARPLTRLEDVLETVGLPAPVAPSVAGAARPRRDAHTSSTTPVEQVAARLGPVPASPDALCRATGLSSPVVLAALAELAVSGRAHATARGWVAAG